VETDNGASGTGYVDGCIQIRQKQLVEYEISSAVDLSKSEYSRRNLLPHVVERDEKRYVKIQEYKIRTVSSAPFVLKKRTYLDPECAKQGHVWWERKCTCMLILGSVFVERYVHDSLERN
jgi:hypothetical protein